MDCLGLLRETASPLPKPRISAAAMDLCEEPAYAVSDALALQGRHGLNPSRPAVNSSKPKVVLHLQGSESIRRVLFVGSNQEWSIKELQAPKDSLQGTFGLVQSALELA